MRAVLSYLLLFSTLALCGQSIKSPSEFLGYDLGTQFTFHHRSVEYFRYVAENSPRVRFVEYGTSYEGRPLIVCIVSAEENLENLESLRTTNLVKTGLMEGKAGNRQVPFIWLSYNVHGNESVGMETSMKALYMLASGEDEETKNWLQETVIFIDPCQNPDGRDLYTNQYRRTQPVRVNPDPDDWSHRQGWPGSRSNHYLFDLNRDWVWQTQKETQQRLAFYNMYMPHVHADFHEMGSESTFFFAPGADPWHEVITPWQHEFHKLTGLENAKLFDGKERLYFTKESFDLFCPSFGDTWPLFNGAMGFTYEQGGGGGAGLAIETETGDTLTLAKRIEGHYLATIATIKTSYNNRVKLISEFNDFFTDGITSQVFEYASIIIKGDNDASAVSALLEQLDRNQVGYSFAGSEGKSFNGFEYLANSEGKVTIEKGDILISSYQPQSHLVKVLFEPDSRFTDSLSYDLTAWALPYVYNIKAFAVKEKIKPSSDKFVIPVIENEKPGERVYAFLVKGAGFNELRFMASLYDSEINIRYALKPFTNNGTEYPRGSLIIARGDNKEAGQRFEELVTELANKNKVKLTVAKTGLSDKGIDLGSNYTSVNKKPVVALVGGEGTSAGSFGQLWYFFEQELGYPVTIIELNNISNADLGDYDVVILPSGNYTKAKEQLFAYAGAGGRIVAFERAISLFAGDKSTKLFNAVELRKKEEASDEKKIKSDDTTLLKKYENMRRESLNSRSANSIYRVKLDDSHPYTFGLGKEWFIMKRSDNYPFIAEGNNIGYILESEPVSGFAGSKFISKVKNSLVIGSERMSKGEIVYITDDPYFRGYWKSGRVLLGNIVLR